MDGYETNVGVGLNLPRANNVISMDLGWSQAIEDQAFDRFVKIFLFYSNHFPHPLSLSSVHRLGQVLPVQVERLVIENTVEDRMLKMQERKVSFMSLFIDRLLKATVANVSRR